MPRTDKKTTDPVVAVTFYSKRTANDPGYYNGIFNEENKNDILSLKEGLKSAAKAKNDPPPKVEITLYLIPDWDKNENFSSPSYMAARDRMIEDAKKTYGEDIIIKDFLSDTNVTQAELNFLTNCKSIGSTADIVKTRAIIDNKGRPCLQTDSNVTWANKDFAKLYDMTFAKNKDAFNSSRCSEVYVSVHNKLIFTGSNSKLPGIFGKTLVDYCTNYNNDSWHKEPSCNGVYDIAFCEGMSQYGVTYRVRVDDRWNPGKTFDFYPANLNSPQFKLMPLVIPCQRESWRAGMVAPPEEIQELTGNLQVEGEGQKRPGIKIEINGVEYDYFHFKSLVRVFTNEPSWHTEQSKTLYAHDTKDYFEGAENTRNLFVAQQNIPLSMEIFAKYYNEVKQAVDENRLHTGGKTLLALARLIPNTEAGNQLTKVLFDCTAQELHDSPSRPAIVFQNTNKYKYEYEGGKSPLHVTPQPTFWQKEKAVHSEVAKTTSDARPTRKT